MAGRGELYGIKPGDEQQALQALQVAKAAFSGPRAPESEASSRFSSPERPSPDQKHLEKALQLLADTRMVFSKAQRNGLVHLHDELHDTAFGAKAPCGSLISFKNANKVSALEAMRDRGQLDWCPKCRGSWPAGLADALSV